MARTTELFQAIDSGDQKYSDELLPLIYNELHALARYRIQKERKDKPMSPTSLVHEAYIRLVEDDAAKRWNGRRHFFSAAAEAMRRILVESARRKIAAKNGGGLRKVELLDSLAPIEEFPERVLEVDEALDALATQDPEAAEVVKHRVFAGMTFDEIAETMNKPRASVHRQWIYGRAWLKTQITDDDFRENL